MEVQRIPMRAFKDVFLMYDAHRRAMEGAAGVLWVLMNKDRLAGGMPNQAASVLRRCARGACEWPHACLPRPSHGLDMVLARPEQTPSPHPAHAANQPL